MLGEEIMKLGANRVLLPMMFGVALSGCSTLPNEWCERGEDPLQAISQLVQRSEQLASQGAAEQQQELVAAQAASEAGDDLGRLRLVLALSQLPAIHDDRRVVSLLAAWPEGEKASLARQFGLVLLRQANEHLRAVKDAREEQRRAEAAREELRRSETLLRDEKKRSDELQQKLDALRVIDREARRGERR